MSYKNQKVVVSSEASSPSPTFEDIRHKLSFGFDNENEDMGDGKASTHEDNAPNQDGKTTAVTTILPSDDLEAQLPQLLDQLRELLKEYPECKKRDSEFLTKFLRVKDYNVPRALDNVRAFYLYTARNHHIIDGIRPDQFRALFDAQIVYILSSRCPLGTKVAVCRMEAWDPSKFSLLQVLRASTLVYHGALEDKETQLRGSTVIFDFKGLSLSHVRQLTPYYLRRLVFAAQEGLPIRLVGVHFINHPYLFWGLYYVARALMKPKLRKRIHFHPDEESLQKQFGKEILPKELGGILDVDDVADKQLIAKLLSHNRDYSYYY